MIYTRLKEKDNRMDIFLNTFGFVGAILLGIIILTLFIKLLNFTSSKMGDPALIKMNKFFNNANRIKVHLAGGKVLENFKFIGFTHPSSMKGGHIPYHLANMVVLENSAAKRILIRADAIKMIEEVDG
jgi:hypothetical protein